MSFYPKTPRCLPILFDLRYPEAEERLRREQAAWCGFAHVEMLSAESAVLIVQPGAATRLAP
jgi:hypothetical protein